MHQGYVNDVEQYLFKVLTGERAKVPPPPFELEEEELP
jgi:hypothetical protein